MEVVEPGMEATHWKRQNRWLGELERRCQEWRGDLSILQEVARDNEDQFARCDWNIEAWVNSVRDQIAL